MIKAYPNLRVSLVLVVSPDWRCSGTERKGLADKIGVVGTVIPSQAAPYLKEGSLKQESCGIHLMRLRHGLAGKIHADGNKVETGTEIPESAKSS
jgi:hypothetical protein